jgi:predicted component of type VI protein secretion system
MQGFRKKMQALLTDEESRNKLLKELSKDDGGGASQAPSEPAGGDDN